MRCNVTRNPNTLWITLQLRETGGNSEQARRFLLFDQDSKAWADVVLIVKARQPLRTAFRASSGTAQPLGRQRAARPAR